MQNDQREALNNHIAVALKPALGELDHFFKCEACGQMVDMRRLGDVFHHEEDGHSPLPIH